MRPPRNDSNPGTAANPWRTHPPERSRPMSVVVAGVLIGFVLAEIAVLWRRRRR
jgi:hypothetical protein